MQTISVNSKLVLLMPFAMEKQKLAKKLYSTQDIATNMKCKILLLQMTGKWAGQET